MLDFDLTKYDTSGMYKVYDMWPKLAEEFYHSDCETIDYKDIDHIIFAGMGGSGALGDVFSSLLYNTNVHVGVVKGYLLPQTVDSNTLVITTSASGNTEEALTILDTSVKRGDCKVLAFSSGGKMQQYCEKNGVDHRNIDQLLSPRASFPNYLYSMLKVLEPIIPIKKTDVEESISYLEQMQKEICSSNLTDSNQSLKLAEWISNIPAIYYPHGFRAAAIRFKNSMQENAKSHATIEDVIESCHNGIVAWEKSTPIQPILVKGRDDHFKTKERWKVLEEYFTLNDIDYWQIMSSSGGILAKIINLIYLLDYATIYLAVKSKVDPNPVRSIDYIKSRLGAV